MATEELVTEHFSMLGVEIDGLVLEKCVDLCNSNGLGPETFAELWMAFSVSNLNGAHPSLELLELMEKKELKKKESDNTKDSKVKDRPQDDRISQTVYQGDVPLQGNGGDVISDYLSNTPKRKSGHQNVKSDPDKTCAGYPASSMCPATYSPTVGNSGKYSARTNSGDVLLNYGNEEILQSSVWLNTSPELFKIVQLPNHEGNIFTTKAMYGFELLQEKAAILDSNIKYLSRHILNKANTADSVSVKHKSQAPVTVVGRIDCDAHGRLNTKSVLLQGTWEESLGQSIAVDLDQLSQFSLFPGQVVAMKGVNTRGDKFIAHEVCCDASYKKPLQINTSDVVSGSLQIIVACGPYTPSDNLSYDPLMDLIKYITRNKPHVAILMGPFIDTNHQNVKDNTIAETYKSFFEKLVDKLMTTLENSSPSTQVVMVASSKDIFHSNIYPTPAFSIKKMYNNLKMVPDPCTLNIGGAVVGVTTTDILMHLSKEEISLPAQGPDRIGRLAGHLINQQSFYPLWPPSSSLAVDTLLWNEHAHMSVTPNILLVPSDFRYFVKEINNCVTINPERLVKGMGGGTFVRIQVNAHSQDQNILCQVVRI